MLIAREEGGDLVVIDRMREMVQIALGLNSKRVLSKGAQKRALDCLQRFGERVRHISPSNVRAVGTNTLRSARNAGDFLRLAEEALGHPIETISGVEEARLIFLGVTRGQTDPGRRRLVIDIGGGSTELAAGRGFKPRELESLYMGCASMTQQFFPKGVIDADGWEKARIFARQELEPVRKRFRDHGWTQAVGTSGTIRAVASSAQEQGWIDEEITPKSLRKLRDLLIKAGHVEEIPIDSLGSRRRDVFPGGVAILQAAFEALKIDRMTVSEIALREGLLVDLIGRFGEEDARDRSVAALADRYHVDLAHADRVEQTAAEWLRRVSGNWALDSLEARKMLCWAARLHEIGLDIAHAQYHKHGEYIIRESDMVGFSRDEQLLLATLVRAHRRKFPLSLIKSLPHRRRVVERLAILLRLAIILHRSRSPEDLPDVSLQAEKRGLRIEFPEGWLENHSLVHAELRHEAETLDDVGYELRYR